MKENEKFIIFTKSFTELVCIFTNIPLKRKKHLFYSMLMGLKFFVLFQGSKLMYYGNKKHYLCLLHFMHLFISEVYCFFKLTLKILFLNHFTRKIYGFKQQNILLFDNFGLFVYKRPRKMKKITEYIFLNMQYP